MAQSKDRRGLGRGLSALMADIEPTAGDEDHQTALKSETLLPIESVRPNPNQPRRSFSETALKELADSIRQKGILQPLIVRRVAGEENTFEIVAGERRWRAAQMAQVHELPVLIRDFNDTEVLEVAIIENIQRADLNPMEEARGYTQLMNSFGHTQEQLAKVMGKSRSHLANVMRLLQLPEGVQDMVVDGRLSAGHARALITSDNPLKLAEQAVAQGWSVRQTETAAKAAASPNKSEGPCQSQQQAL